MSSIAQFFLTVLLCIPVFYLIGWLSDFWECKDCKSWSTTSSEQNAYITEIHQKLSDANEQRFNLTVHGRNAQNLCKQLMDFLEEYPQIDKLKATKHQIKKFKKMQENLNKEWQEIFEEKKSVMELYDSKPDKFQEGSIKRVRE